jgi:hypothetical protein
MKINLDTDVKKFVFFGACRKPAKMKNPEIHWIIAYYPNYIWRRDLA